MVYEETGKGLTPFAGELPRSAMSAIERADDDAIVSALTTGRGAEEYLYRILAEGKEVVGISTAGAFEVARLLGNIEALPGIQAERDETDYRDVVRVRDVQRNVTVLGAAIQPLMKQVNVRDGQGREMGGSILKPDAHAWTIGVNKAQRNGILHLTPADAVARIVEGFLAGGKVRRLAGDPAAKAAPPEDDSFPPPPDTDERQVCWKDIQATVQSTGSTAGQVQLWFKKNHQLSLTAVEASADRPPQGATLEMLKRLRDMMKEYRDQERA